MPQSIRNRLNQITLLPLCAAALAGALTVPAATAADWQPTKPVEIVVAAGAGGATLAAAIVTLTVAGALVAFPSLAVKVNEDEPTEPTGAL